MLTNGAAVALHHAKPRKWYNDPRCSKSLIQDHSDFYSLYSSVDYCLSFTGRVTWGLAGEESDPHCRPWERLWPNSAPEGERRPSETSAYTLILFSKTKPPSSVRALHLGLRARLSSHRKEMQSRLLRNAGKRHRTSPRGKVKYGSSDPKR